MNTILLALFVGLCCGLVIGACLRPRRHRVSAAVLKPHRDEPGPYVGRWTKEHAR